LGIFDYEDAIECYEEIIKLSEEMNIDRLTLTNYYSESGSINYYGGNYKKALDYHQKEISIREEMLDRQHLDLAASYNNIARIYRALANFTKALEYNKKVLEIYEASPDTNPTEI